MKNYAVFTSTILFAGLTCGVMSAQDRIPSGCENVPTYDQLKAALTTAQTATNGGYSHHVWGTIVNRDGIVCSVAYTGKTRSGQWPGSRIISAQKASTANAFSLPGMALSTASLYSATQPGGTLAGLGLSNPVNAEVAYRGNEQNYGRSNDAMVGGVIGGVNTFGGGLALYDSNHNLVGGLGVSGDSSCADHNVAWRTRAALSMDYVPSGTMTGTGPGTNPGTNPGTGPGTNPGTSGPATGTASGDNSRPDNIVFDIANSTCGSGGLSAGGWGHPSCGANSASIAAMLPATRR